jgi:hypothetical protein
MAALLGIAAAVILIAVAVIYLLTRDTGKSKNTAATAPVPTTATTVTPTFLPGAQGGAPTTVPDTTPTTVATTSPPTTAAPAPATTAAPAPNPAANIAFSYIDAQCINGQLQVRGSATNNNPATYSFTFAVQIVDASGNVLGRADNGSIGHLASHGSTGFVVTGSCSNVTGGHPQQQVTSITPG